MCASMSVAGFDTASIFRASSAAISVGMKMKMNTSVPTTRESCTDGSSPALCPALSAPAAASRLVTSPRSTFATSQPTKPITSAAKMLGNRASTLFSMACTGESSPCRS
ncbi:hypothetical protein D3C83_38120 [compost metagenome]